MAEATQKTSGRASRVLITGASAGIGQALAYRYSTASTLIVTGRRPRFAGSGLPEHAIYRRLDQTQPYTAESHLDEILSECASPTLDLAILNAGIGHYGDPLEESGAELRETLAVNLESPLALAHGLFPHLEPVGGRLVLVGSVAHRGHGKLASYTASKAGLDGLGRALCEEWRGRVGVTTVHPGPTRTGMHAKAGLDAGRAERWFIPAEAMAAMIAGAAEAGRDRATLSFGAYARHRLTAGGRRPALEVETSA